MKNCCCEIKAIASTHENAHIIAHQPRSSEIANLFFCTSIATINEVVQVYTSNVCMIMCFHKCHQMYNVVNSADNFLDLSIYFIERFTLFLHIPGACSALNIDVCVCVLSALFGKTFILIGFSFGLIHLITVAAQVRISTAAAAATRATTTILGLQLWLWLSWFVHSLTFTRTDSEPIDRCCCIHFSGHLIQTHTDTHIHNMALYG